MKTRADVNRANYLKHRAQRQEKARLRKRALTDSWRQAIAEWDREFTAPTDAAVQAACLSDWSVMAAFTEPLDVLIAQEDDHGYALLG